MTLLELLVKELPQRGGWPEGYSTIATDGLKSVWAYASNGRIAGRHMHLHCNEHGCVTREQYEAAISAQQPVWNGDGLPPVGVECEALYGLVWHPCVVVAHYDGFVFAWNYDLRITFTVNEIKVVENFRPIRTEADLKRIETVQIMCNLFGNGIQCNEKTGYGEAWFNVYDTIASGKIPGIRLADD